MPAITGISRMRDSDRSHSVGAGSANSTIEIATTSSRNAVPQRGWAGGYLRDVLRIERVVVLKAWMVMCSAPW